MFRFQQARSTPKTASQPLSPKIFFDLAGECQLFATGLARLDPLQVHLQSCHRFNDWLPILRSYDKLAQRITLRAARPIARWQVLTLGMVGWFILLLALPGRTERATTNLVLSGWLIGLILFYFVPQALYGTTVELLEGRLLKIVETMQSLLQMGEIPFSEAAYFRVKEILEETQRELRQQIDLAHRNDRSYL